MRLRAEHIILFGILTGCAAGEPDEAVVSDASPRQVQIDADVVYGHKFGMALTFDVYHPAEPNGAGVIIVNSWGGTFHTEEDGQYRLLDDSELSPFQFSARLLVENGFTVFNLRHGSSPKFVLPEIVADVRRAVRVIRDVAPDYGVNPERLGLWGGSAGGHLSLLLGASPEIGPQDAVDGNAPIEARVAAVVAYYPPSDLEAWRVEVARFTSEEWGQELLTVFPAMDYPPERDRELSPVHYATADDPPTLIIHGDQDRLVLLSQGQLMYDALLEAGATSELIVVEGAGHGFEGEDIDLALAQSLAWFQRYLQ